MKILLDFYRQISFGRFSGLFRLTKPENLEKNINNSIIQNPKHLNNKNIGVLLFFTWLLIGLGLRLINLSEKSPWTDEFSTLVFSLGNSFLGVPLDQVISIDTLLQPLQPNPEASINSVLQYLFTESNHPPLYFVLTHLWLKLFQTDAGLVSVWGARLLPAIFGAFSIPIIFAFSWLTFRSRLISHFAAAMMAVSPFGIFLAQEARHYTLAILWVIASLACLITAINHINNRTKLPILIALSWVIVNALGIATHYFFFLTLCAEVFVLVFMIWQQWKQKDVTIEGRNFSIFDSPWKRIYAVAFGTFATGIVWLPIFISNSYGNKLTDWIQGERVGLAWISPIFQAMAAWITMISLLPVEAPQLGVVITSGCVMLAFFIWLVPILIRNYKLQLSSPQTQLMTQALSSLVLGAIILFFIFTYFLGIDLTRGARYNFVYFPAVIVLIGVVLAAIWNQNREQLRWGINGKQTVAIILVMGFISSITVVCNLGYQKYYRPDIFIKLIEQTSQVPIVIATTQKTHVQIGEMMGVARELKIQNFHQKTNQKLNLKVQFLLARQGQDKQTPTITLKNALNKLPKPLDLWAVNFHAPISINNCIVDNQPLQSINGYNYKLYHCQ